jgi:hypothetical protein
MIFHTQISFPKPRILVLSGLKIITSIVVGPVDDKRLSECTWMESWSRSRDSEMGGTHGYFRNSSRPFLICRSHNNCCHFPRWPTLHFHLYFLHLGLLLLCYHLLVFQVSHQNPRLHFNPYWRTTMSNGTYSSTNNDFTSIFSFSELLFIVESNYFS